MEQTDDPQRAGEPLSLRARLVLIGSVAMIGFGVIVTYEGFRDGWRGMVVPCLLAGALAGWDLRSRRRARRSRR